MTVAAVAASAAARRWSAAAARRSLIVVDFVPSSSPFVPSSSLFAAERLRRRRRSSSSSPSFPRGRTSRRRPVIFGAVAGVSPSSSSSSSAVGFSTLTNAFWDVVRTGSLNPPNPIVSFLEKEENSGRNDGNDSLPTSSSFPDFGRIRPDHVLSAARIVQGRYEASLSDFERQLSSNESTFDDDDASLEREVMSTLPLSGTSPSSHSSSDDDVVLDRDDLIVEELDKIEYPLRFVRAVGSLVLHSKGRNDPETERLAAETSRVLDRGPSVCSEIVGRALREVEGRSAERLEEEERGREEEAAASGTTADGGGGEGRRRRRGSSFRTTERRLRVVRRLLSERIANGLTLSSPADRGTFESLRGTLEESKRYFLALQSSVDDGKSKRESIRRMYEVLSAKTQMAKLLGYENAAEASFDLTDRAAPTVKSVEELLEFVRERFLPIAEEMTADGEEDDDDDVDVDVRAYLRLDRVLDGLFRLCRTLFGVHVEEAKEANGWDEDVRLFHLRGDEPEENFDYDNDDAGLGKGRYLGSFYLDPYKRPNKVPFNRVGVLRHGRRCPDADIKPLVYLSIDVAPPVWDDAPAQMTFDDAIALFHEFGHVLQCLLVDDAELGGGVSTIETDLEEMPAMFMERWLFREDFLRTIARSSDEPIPSELFDRLKRRHRRLKILELLRAAFLAKLDLDLHRSFDPNDDDRSILDVQRDAAEQFLPNAMRPTRGDVSPLMEVFHENCTRDESATSYRYLWSEAVASDAYSKFDEEERIGKGGGTTTTTDAEEEEENMRRPGREFRRSFLECAGTRMSDPSDRFRTFRGGGI